VQQCKGPQRLFKTLKYPVKVTKGNAGVWMMGKLKLITEVGVKGKG
jgi:hypothetical protein